MWTHRHFSLLRTLSVLSPLRNYMMGHSNPECSVQQTSSKSVLITPLRCISEMMGIWIKIWLKFSWIYKDKPTVPLLQVQCARISCHLLWLLISCKGKLYLSKYGQNTFFEVPLNRPWRFSVAWYWGEMFSIICETKWTVHVVPEGLAFLLLPLYGFSFFLFILSIFLISVFRPYPGDRLLLISPLKVTW